jgi:hypothetical protein
MRTTEIGTQGHAEAEQPEAETAEQPASRQSFTARGSIPPVDLATADPGPSASDRAYGSSHALPANLRSKFERSLGADLGDVRIHQDAREAAGVGAKALTQGQEIHMAPGQYAPDSREGEELLAHEVAHTVQQRGASERPQAKGERPAPATSQAEQQADQAASAMVSGGQASVSPVGEQQPHAKEYSRGELITAYNGSLARQDWADAALRLNGFNDDDIALLAGKMSGGQRAHVREAAEVAMPGWSQRVTGGIDAVDADAAKIAGLYAAYEKAVAQAKASGDWHEVIDRLNGMGDWDQQDRLKKLTWFDYEAMRGQTDNKRVLAAIDKADTARVQRINAAYAAAIASQDWTRAANQLHGMSEDDIRGKLDELASKPETISYLKRIKEVASKDARLVAIIDDVAKAHGEVVPGPMVLTPMCEIPDVSDDHRELATVDFANFGGDARVAKFARDLENVYNAHRAESGRTDNTKTDKALVDHFATSFATTGTHYAKMIAPKMGFGRWAKQWMSEMRERADLDSGTKLADAQLPTGIGKMKFSEADLQRIDSKHGFSDGEVKNKAGDVVKKGQLVHPFVNNFMDVLAAKGTGFSASTYPGHGGSDEIAPFCLDVFPKIQLDDRGLYQPDQMVEFIEKINAAAGDGNWSGIYNDTALLRELPRRGLAGKVDTQAADGSHNFHGALNLHIHLYLRPPADWAPGAPDPQAAPKVDPSKEQH